MTDILSAVSYCLRYEVTLKQVITGEGFLHTPPVLIPPGKGQPVLKIDNSSIFGSNIIASLILDLLQNENLLIVEWKV